MRVDKRFPAENRLMLRAIGLGALVFLTAFAAHTSLDAAKQLGPLATEVTNAPRAILWFLLIWGGWPLALTVIASRSHFGQMSSYEVAATSVAIGMVGAFVATCIESTQRATAIASELAFNGPFCAARTLMPTVGP